MLAAEPARPLCPPILEVFLGRATDSAPVALEIRTKTLPTRAILQLRQELRS
jgi:hypothetical protein